MKQQQPATTSATKPIPRWATPAQCADYIGSTVASLCTWRCTEPKRLPFHKLGKKVIYDLNEVDAVLITDR